VVSICSRCIFHCSGVTSYLRSCTAHSATFINVTKKLRKVLFWWLFCNLVVTNNLSEWPIFLWKSKKLLRRNNFRHWTTYYKSLYVPRLSLVAHLAFILALAVRYDAWTFGSIFESLEYEGNSSSILFSNKVIHKLAFC
jgi:hypothetical protein